MASNKKNPLVLVISDLHSGGTTALAQPGFILDKDSDEEREMTLSAGQRWMWNEVWQPMVERLRTEVRRKGRVLITLFGGDAVDGKHPRKVQALPNVDDQERMACEILEPVRALSRYMAMCKGTEAHVGLVGQSERRIARYLEADLDYEHRVDVNGILHSILHHGRTSSRRYYTAATSIAAEILMTCAEYGYPVPRFAWRAHKHTVNDTGAHYRNIRVVTLPGWQMKSYYVWKAQPEKVTDIGYVLVDGEDVDIVTLAPKRRRVKRVRL